MAKSLLNQFDSQIPPPSFTGFGVRISANKECSIHPSPRASVVLCFPTCEHQVMGSQVESQKGYQILVGNASMGMNPL